MCLRYNIFTFTRLLQNIMCLENALPEIYYTTLPSGLSSYIILSRLGVIFSPLRKIDEFVTEFCSSSQRRRATVFAQPRIHHDQRNSASKIHLSDATIRIIENDVECGEFSALHFSQNWYRNVQTVLQGKAESVPGQVYYWNKTWLCKNNLLKF